MLTKIILTLLVIAASLWYLSARRVDKRRPTLVVMSKQESHRRQLLRRGAYGFMLVMVVAAAAMIYAEISENYQVVTVQVINTQSGTQTNYQARRDDIGSSSFTTLEGRTVFVAGIERIEVIAR